MLENRQSYNTTVLGLSPLKFLLPEWPQIILYFFITLIIFLAANTRIFLDFLNLGDIGQYSSTLLKAWHYFSSSNLVAGLLWGALGCGIYLCIWFFRSLVTNIRNDLVVANYVHPVTYKEYLYWRSLILRKAFFGISFLALLAYLYAGVKIFIALAGAVYWQIESGLNYTGYIKLLAALAAGMVLLHGFTLVLKITLNFWQFIYRDL